MTTKDPQHVAISWDPGSYKTGYCIWVDGKIEECGVIKTKGKTPAERLTSLYRQALDIVEPWGPNSVAIEDFGRYHSRDKQTGQWKAKESMMRCAAAQGVILAACDDRIMETKIQLISKGGISKAETALLAKAYGITTDEQDALDSFQIGICAAFDKRQKGKS